MLAGLEGNTAVWMDIGILGKPAGRLEIELFTAFVPKTCDNFRALCTGEKGVGQLGKKLHYKGCHFHRIIGSFMLQGGDITHGNGEGGESIYGETFADEAERGWGKHAAPGLLVMANKGPDTNSSQFYITLNALPWLDGKHVVFGRVANGLNVIDKIEEYAMKLDDDKGVVPGDVVITDCGQAETKDKKTQ